ncbi:hypothetical protein Scep_014433 [Stephania cephalantha]|uniref:NusB/RsmB/TIM44 domain-containing protein n=1 Tax=Stephania cephalantha TaxID=152367 RepID=A0AAP0NZD8_9MAGN
MEGTSVLSLSSSQVNIYFHSITSSLSSQHARFLNIHFKDPHKLALRTKNQVLLSSPRTALLSPAQAITETLERSTDPSSSSPSSSRESLPKLDKSGRFCSPRAARELALSILYAACLEGCDPVRLFEKRLSFRREPGYEFDKETLLEYNHMSFSGRPVWTRTEEEVEELRRKDEEESAIEAEVLSAPPKMVYSKLILRLARKMLVAVVDGWDNNVLAIEKIAPPNWKDEPVGKILELCILHLAMAEIAMLRTRYQIVINEAVDLAKRFCEGTAPRIINGCLRTYVKSHNDANAVHPGEVQ